MTEFDCDIEFLDEDADIISQYMQPVDIKSEELEEMKPPKSAPASASASLLIERRSKSSKRKRWSYNDDTDYDPFLDQDYIHRKRPKRKPQGTIKAPVVAQKSVPQKIERQQLPKPKATVPAKSVEKDFRLYDYQDSLCLPVTLMNKESENINRVTKWNELCITQVNKYLNKLEVKGDPVTSTVRTIVLKNFEDKGKVNTSVWYKLCAKSDSGNKVSEVYQGVLPKFKEKKILSFSLTAQNKKALRIRDLTNTVLTLEEHKDGQVLVVYKVKDSTVTVYKLIDENLESDKLESRRNLLKLTRCKICALCYQYSWRGIDKNSKKGTVQCCVCKRNVGSLSNFFSHIRSHTNAEVTKYRPLISAGLAKNLEYHYKCRICNLKCTSVIGLRKHVRKQHRGRRQFKCDIGLHLTF